MRSKGNISKLAFAPLWVASLPENASVLSTRNVLLSANGKTLSVFPTPFYETILGIFLFIFLWSIRKRIRYAGGLFAVYLMVNGLERFCIEKIRVNTTYSLGTFHPTQAELIAASLFLLGLFLYFRFSPKTATR